MTATLFVYEVFFLKLAYLQWNLGWRSSRKDSMISFRGQGSMGSPTLSTILLDPRFDS